MQFYAFIFKKIMRVYQGFMRPKDVNLMSWKNV